jgi:hypothetical protein
VGQEDVQQVCIPQEHPAEDILPDGSLPDCNIEMVDVHSPEVDHPASHNALPISPSHAMPPPLTDSSLQLAAEFSISPTIIRSRSVEPPLGMLAPEFNISPASSQPTISSPSPNPNSTFLTVVANRTSEMPSRPMTRSRSRSRSPTRFTPAERATVRRTPPVKKAPSSKGKPRSRRG